MYSLVQDQQSELYDADSYWSPAKKESPLLIESLLCVDNKNPSTVSQWGDDGGRGVGWGNGVAYNKVQFSSSSVGTGVFGP